MRDALLLASVPRQFSPHAYPGKHRPGSIEPGRCAWIQYALKKELISRIFDGTLWSSDLTTEKDYAGTLKKLQSMNVLGGLVFLTVPGMIADLCGSYKPAYFVDLACYVIAAICMITLYRKYAGRRIRVAPSGT